MFNPAALLTQLNPTAMLPNTLIKNQALSQALSQALKLQSTKLFENGGSSTSPLDLSSKKDDNEEDERSTPIIEPTTSIAKIEEIDELESADTRVSV